MPADDLDNGTTPYEHDAVLNLLRANAASNGFADATVDDDLGVPIIVDPVPLCALWLLTSDYQKRSLKIMLFLIGIYV